MNYELNNKMNNSIKKEIYSLIRELYLKYEIGKLGKIKEEEDKIICHITKIKKINIAIIYI